MPRLTKAKENKVVERKNNELTETKGKHSKKNGENRVTKTEKRKLRKSK
jgi:hypothetical protein